MTYIPDHFNSHERRVMAQFEDDIIDHGPIQVLHDQGLYRHLRYQRPGSSMYWFDLITVPGLLTINGDMGTFSFARLEDMFAFFDNGKGYVNPGYWGEKLRGRRSWDQKVHSESQFKSWIVQDFWERRHDVEPEEATKVWKEIRDGVFDRFSVVDTTDRDSCIRHLQDIEDLHENWDYSDPWEHDWSEWDHHFLWNLHAIVYGIREYRKHQEAMENLRRNLATMDPSTTAYILAQVQDPKDLGIAGGGA